MPPGVFTKELVLNRLSFWLLFLFVLVSDQLTKIAARFYLLEGESYSVFPNFNFTLVYNPGAAFGMFGTLPTMYRRIALMFVSLLALIVVLRFLLKDAKGDRISELSLSAILAGAFGNIIDRFRFDAVVDFLDVFVGTHHWPAFNIADSAICVGVTLLILRLLFSDSFAGEDAQDEVVTEVAS